MKVSKKDILFGYLSQGLNVGVGLCILPVALNKLSSEDMGLWLIFMSIVSLVTLLDFGFSPTVSRNITYVLSGAKSLEKTGIQHKKNNTDIDYTLFFNLIAATRKVYQRIGNLSFLILAIAGSVYIHSVVSKDNIAKPYYIYTSWAIYAITITFNMYYLYFSPVLLGSGQLTRSYLVNIISRSIMIIFSVCGLLLGYGLITLAMAYAISIFVERIVCYKFLYNEKFIEMKNKYEVKNKNIAERKKIISVLWHNSSRVGMVTLGAVLINKSSALVAGFYLPLNESASYIMTFQVLWVLMSVSQIYFQTHVPLFSKLQVEKDKEGLKKKYLNCLVVTLFLMILGCVCCVIIGPWILKNIIHTKTSLLDTSMLIAISVILTLELNHSVAGGFITTANSIPFVKAALLSGIGIVFLSIFSLGYLQVGLWGLILSQGIVQLLYNNWKWPVFAWKMLKAI